VFVILESTPGDPAMIILGRDASPDALNALREELGFNKPMLLRYLDYVQGIFTRFDFGESYRSKQPVFDNILVQFPTTLKLAIFSVIVASIIGIPLGIVSAVRQYSLTDVALTVSALFLASIPGFWLSLLLVLFFSLLLGVLPSTGIDSWKNYILPVATLALPSAAILMRITRAQMMEVWKQDYIRTARAKGANEWRVITKHAIKNALMPVITIVGMSFAGLLGGTVIVELIFGMPGLGNLIISAIKLKDIPIVMAGTIFLSTLFMLIMLLVDLLYAFIDPRTKSQFKR
jgi:peptide/nickel transport system permease protein